MMHRITIEIDTEPDIFEGVSNYITDSLYQHLGSENVPHRFLAVKKESKDAIITRPHTE